MAGVLRPNDIRRLIVFSVVLLVVVPAIAWFAGGAKSWQEANWQPGLNLAALAAAPLATRLHAIAILILVIAGWTMLTLPKGDRRHRLMGWTWVSGMVLMGLASMAVPHGDSWVAAYVGGGSALVLHGIRCVFRPQWQGAQPCTDDGDADDRAGAYDNAVAAAGARDARSVFLRVACGAHLLTR